MTVGIAGALVAIKIQTITPATFVQLAGMRAKSIKINNDFIDITNSDSTNRSREYLAGQIAVRSFEITGDGVCVDGAGTDRLVLVALQAGAQEKFQFFVPTLGTFEGTFGVAGLDIGGNDKGEVTIKGTFASAADIVFTTIA